MSRSVTNVAIFAALAAAIGCGSATVRKVPSRGQYAAWTDAEQKAADSMEGYRYYLTRPFVAVHRPFAIQADAFLVDGVVAADGESILVTGAAAAGDARFQALKHAATPAGAADLRIPTRYVFGDSERGPAAPRAQGLKEKAKEVEPEPDDDTDDAKGTKSEKTGVSKVTVTTDTMAVSVIPIRDFFDVVYLPDFDEQYVVDPRARFGSVGLDLTLGPGGTLLGMGVDIDNSAITGPLIEAYEDALKTALAAGKTALGLPPLPSGGGLGIPAAQGAVSAEADLARQPLTPVTLRVTVVRFASPGLYPVLKPSELKNVPADVVAQAKERHVVPVHPFSAIAFSFFETIVVEHLVGGSSPATAAEPSEAPDDGATKGGLPANEALASAGVRSLLRGNRLEPTAVNVDETTPDGKTATQATVRVKRTDGKAPTAEDLENARKKLETHFPATKFAVERATT